MEWEDCWDREGHFHLIQSYRFRWKDAKTWLTSLFPEKVEKEIWKGEGLTEG